MSCSREPCALACWSIPTTPPHSPLSLTFRLRPCPSGSKSKSSRPPSAVTSIRSLRALPNSRSRRSDELRSKHHRRISPGRRVHRPDSQGREARRPTGLTVGQVRVRHQPQHRQGIRPQLPAGATRHRRRGDRMRRREFIALIGGATATWPLAARAQHAGRVYRIGLFGGLSVRAPGPEAVMGLGYPAFRDELRKRGFIDGRNLVIELRSTRQEASRLYADAAELVRSNVDVIVAAGPEVAVKATLAASRTVPIVMWAN